MTKELHKKVEDVLDKNVRPALSRHNGNVSIKEISGDGVLKVCFTGQCGGCPSSRLTLESLVAKEVMEIIPEIRDVVMIDNVSDELWDTARRILRGGGISGIADPDRVRERA